MNYLILNRGQYFWRPNRAGYGYLYEAGVYSEKEAKQAERDRPMEDKAIPIWDYEKDLRNIKENVERLMESLYE